MAWQGMRCDAGLLITDGTWTEIWFRIAEPASLRVTRRLSDPIWRHVVDSLALEDMVT